MPVVSRQRLRQQVGLTRLRDTFVGTTTFSPNLGAGSTAQIMAIRLANTALTGQALYQNTTLRLIGIDYHVASFNVGSGALVSAQLAATTVGSGSTFEHHRKLSADQKDREIDGIVGRLWSRQEVPLNSVSGQLYYSIGQGFKVFGAYYFGVPVGTTSREVHTLPVGWDIVTTGSGRELRLPEGGALNGSAQLVLDAQVHLTLGATDTATVNVPDEDWVLNGIAARCYQAMSADAPGQEAGKYRDFAIAYAREFNRNIGRFRDQVTYDFRGAFDEFVGEPVGRLR